jgi:Na+/melibiose symporter and related transporters
MGKIKEMIAQIKLNEQDPAKMKLKEYVSYALGNFCYTSVGMMSATYLLLFYTSVGLDSVTAASIIAATKIWDAVNDPIVATVIDNAHFRSGRFKPYLAKLVPLLSVLSILIFIRPPISSRMFMIIWCAGAYMLWETVNTFSSVSFGAMSTVMSTDNFERSAYMTIGRLGYELAGAVPGLIPVAFEFIVPRYLSQANFITVCAAVFAALGCAAGLYTKNLKERIAPPVAKQNIFEGFVLLFKNKQLLLLWSSNVSAVLSSVGWAVGAFFFIYSVEHYSVQTIVWLITGIPGILVMLLSPIIIKRFRPSRIVIFSSILNSACYLLAYFIVMLVGYTTVAGIVLLIFFILIASVPSGVSSIASNICNVNTYDYMEMKTGKRAEATSMVVTGMMTKGIYALGVLFAGFMLKYIGFHEGEGVVQSQRTKDGLFLFYAVFPAIGGALSIIPYFFFKLEGKKFDDAIREFRERKEAEKDVEANGLQTMSK